MTAQTETLPKTVSELLAEHGTEFYDWQSARVAEGGYARPGSDDRDRYDRCYEASEDGCDGSTHQEHIDDFREFGRELFKQAERELFRADGTDAEFDALEAKQAAFEADCDSLEEWHSKNGTLNESVG